VAAVSESVAAVSESSVAAVSESVAAVSESVAAVSESSVAAVSESSVAAVSESVAAVSESVAAVSESVARSSPRLLLPAALLLQPYNLSPFSSLLSESLPSLPPTPPCATPNPLPSLSAGRPLPPSPFSRKIGFPGLKSPILSPAR